MNQDKKLEIEVALDVRSYEKIFLYSQFDFKYPRHWKRNLKSVDNNSVVIMDTSENLEVAFRSLEKIRKLNPRIICILSKNNLDDFHSKYGWMENWKIKTEQGEAVMFIPNSYVLDNTVE